MKIHVQIRFLVLLISSVVVGLLAGCGGGGGSGSAGSTSGTTTLNGSTVIPTTTKILDDGSSAKIASIAPDQSTVTFTDTTSQISNLKSGDVLVLGVTPATPQGLLKKVVGVQKNANGKTVLQTGPATLEEAVQQVSVSYKKTFTDSDVVSEVNVAKGVSKAAPLSASPGVISLNLEDVVIYDRDNNLQTTGDQITVNGTISFKPTVDMNIDIDSSTLKKFTFSVTGEESSELTISAKVPVPSLDKKKLLKTYNLGTQVFWIGYVPVVASYELGIYVGVKGNISLGLSANTNQKLSYTGGVSYENNSWAPITASSTEFGFQLPTIDASAEAKCYAGPELSVKLYGVAGPYINIYGYLLLQANVQNTPWWELFAGFEGYAGAKIEMLSGRITARYDVNIFNIKKSLKQAPDKAPNASTYKLSGLALVNGTGVAGVTINLNGAASNSTTTNASGYYLFSNLINGTYSVAAAKAGYSFTPSVINNLTVKGADVLNQNFAATVVQGAYSISGTIHSGSNSGAALAGATVSIAGKTATTSSTGTFSITDIPAGTYVFSVSKSGYDTYTNPAYAVGSNQSELGFYLTLQPVAYSISGTIHSGSNSGAVLSGATVSIAGKTTTTSSTGTFSITDISAGTYAFSVSKSGYDTYTNPAYYVGSSQSGLNFYLVPQAITYFSISGIVYDNSNAGTNITGATVSIAGITATTSSTGAFTITGIPTGTYVLAVSKSGYNTYTNSTYHIGSNQTGLNFYLDLASPFGAQAVNLSTCAAGLSWNYQTIDLANASALQRCGAGCSIVAVYGKGTCAAYAKGSSGCGGGTGYDTLIAAMSNAISQCSAKYRMHGNFVGLQFTIAELKSTQRVRFQLLTMSRIGT